MLSLTPQSGRTDPRSHPQTEAVQVGGRVQCISDLFKSTFSLDDIKALTFDAASSLLGQFDRKVFDGCSDTEEEDKRNSVLPSTAQRLARVMCTDSDGSYVNSSIASDRRAPSKASQS